MTMIFPSMGGGLGSALPYQGSVSAAQLSTFLDLESADVVRLKRYTQHWQFYHTLQWNFEREEGAPLVTVNYARLIVDKAVSWMVKGGIEHDVPKALEGIVKPLLDEVWKYNDQEVFLYEMGTVGAVTGDVFIMITFAEPTDLARKRNPNSQGQIRIDLLGSEQCFPTWDPLNTDVMTSLRIETVYYDHNTKLRAIDDDNHPRQGQGNITVRRFTQIITPDTIIEQYEGGPPFVRPNVLGEIPVVHIKNLPIAREFYGISDLDNVMPLQQELNEKTTDESDIIHYHAGPITVITGGKGATLEYGPNKIWSGFPAEARVSNLEMTTDLGAIQEYIGLIRKTILELTETPEILLEQPNISNTSGVALQLMYQPIVDKTKRKSSEYEKGFALVNYYILRVAQTMGLISLPFDLCKNCGGRVVERLEPNTQRLIRKCYMIHPEDYSWMSPEDVEVINIRQHSFGFEVKESPMSQIQSEHMQIGASAWDPANEQSQQQAQNLRIQDLDKAANARPVEQRPTPQGQVPAPAPQPQNTPRLTAEPPKLQGEITLPEEPETVTLSTLFTNPITGGIGQIRREVRTLVPTGCKKPQYLDPYYIPVKMKNSVPRDEQLELQENMELLREGIVSTKWVRRQTTKISPDEYDQIEEEIQDDLRDKARPEGVLPEAAADAVLQGIGKGKKTGPERSELQRSALPGGHNSPTPTQISPV